MGMGFAPTWLRQVSPPPASQNHFNHCNQPTTPLPDSHTTEPSQCSTHSDAIEISCRSVAQVGAECAPARLLGDGCYDGPTNKDDALGVCLLVDTDLAFVAMCLAAACGHHEIVELIGNAGQKQILY